MLEKTIERHLVTKVAACGGLCFKFKSTVNGVPDRIVLHNGKVYFIELKRGDGEVSKLQTLTHDQIKQHGGTVFTLWSKGDVDWFVSEHL